MKKKVLFVYDNLLHYRIPLFNKLGEKYDFTVIHSGKGVFDYRNTFKEIVYKGYKLGPLLYRPQTIKHIYAKDYDVILYNFDVRWIVDMACLLFPVKTKKHILWGAWMTESSIANSVRLLFLKRYKSLFYCHKSRMEFVDQGVAQDTTWVANNTVEINNRVESYKYDKDIILSSGTLNKRKKNESLIRAFSEILPHIDKKIKLVFIGDGVDMPNLKKLVQELEIDTRVVFLGKILDEELLISYFKRSYISVSFGQAGLSILHSFGYGVPYITSKHAISGGETSNIKNNLNGILTENSEKSLQENLLKVLSNIKIAKEMGENAYNYYSEYCTMKNMTQGFIDAIENTREAKVD